MSVNSRKATNTIKKKKKNSILGIARYFTEIYKTALEKGHY